MVPPASDDPRPVGVFDSGVGGLTVARALMDLLPDERIVYFGDTARGPYGPRDLGDVRAYTAEIVDWLAESDCKLVVAACNTATAAALTTDALDLPVPVVGVIQPAVEAAVRATATSRVGVIGTVGTIASGAYDRAVAEAAPGVKLLSQACPPFVEFVEAGRTTDREVLDAVADHLAPLVAGQVDTLILGCTHYPLLTGALSYVMGPGVVLVSSAEETARRVFARLVDTGQLAGQRTGEHRFVVSGDGSEFSRLAHRFLGPRLSGEHVEALGRTPSGRGEGDLTGGAERRRRGEGALTGGAERRRRGEGDLTGGAERRRRGEGDLTGGAERRRRGEGDLTGGAERRRRGEGALTGGAERRRRGEET